MDETDGRQQLMRVNITGHVTAHCADVSGPSALPVPGLHQCSGGCTTPGPVSSRPIRRGFGGRVQVNITTIIRHREAKVAQNPNVSEGLSVTYSDSRQSESGVSVLRWAWGPQDLLRIWSSDKGVSHNTGPRR